MFFGSEKKILGCTEKFSLLTRSHQKSVTIWQYRLGILYKFLF